MRLKMAWWVTNSLDGDQIPIYLSIYLSIDRSIDTETIILIITSGVGWVAKFRI